jgi:Na+/proline symporter
MSGTAILYGLVGFVLAFGTIFLPGILVIRRQRKMDKKAELERERYLKKFYKE